MRISLFAKRLIREDICVATSEDIELQSLEADWPLIGAFCSQSSPVMHQKADLNWHPVMLKSCHPAAGTEYTCVALHIVAQQLEDIDMDNVAPPLSVPRKWEEMNRYVTLLINMGDLVANVSHHPLQVRGFINSTCIVGPNCASGHVSARGWC